MPGQETKNPPADVGGWFGVAKSVRTAIPTVAGADMRHIAITAQRPGSRSWPLRSDGDVAHVGAGNGGVAKKLQR